MLPQFDFLTLRDARLIDNALADVLPEPENVRNFTAKVYDRIEEHIIPQRRKGIDALMMADDWGTQDHTFISPESFRELFKPFYKRLTDSFRDISEGGLIIKDYPSYSDINVEEEWAD